MFVITNLKQLERAAIKARQVKPIVRIIEFGTYAVKGSSGNFYTVKCRKENNQKIVECECKGASKICYHGAAVIELHSTLAKHRNSVII